MKRQGYVLAELVVVLFLLILISVFVFLLTESGSQTYLRLLGQQTRASDLRIGLAYLDVQVKRHDQAGGLLIMDRPDDTGQALVFTREAESGPYLTWIYVHQGFLCELTLAQERSFNPEGGSRIASIDHMHLQELDAGRLQVTLMRQGPETTQEASRTLLLRSQGALP